MLTMGKTTTVHVEEKKMPVSLKSGHHHEHHHHTNSHKPHSSKTHGPHHKPSASCSHAHISTEFNATFTFPPHWDKKCKSDRKWCRSFIKKLINQIVMQSIFTDVTFPTLKGAKLDQIKKECKGNQTCIKQKMKQERSAIMEDYMVNRVAGTTENSTATLIIGLVSGMLLMCVILGIIYFLCCGRHRKHKSHHVKREGSRKSHQTHKTSRRSKVRSNSRRLSSSKVKLSSGQKRQSRSASRTAALKRSTSKRSHKRSASRVRRSSGQK